jgi:hypothetical protein
VRTARPVRTVPQAACGKSHGRIERRPDTRGVSGRFSFPGTLPVAEIVASQNRAGAYTTARLDSPAAHVIEIVGQISSLFTRARLCAWDTSDVARANTGPAHKRTRRRARQLPFSAPQCPDSRSFPFKSCRSRSWPSSRARRRCRPRCWRGMRTRKATSPAIGSSTGPSRAAQARRSTSAGSPAGR